MPSGFAMPSGIWDGEGAAPSGFGGFAMPSGFLYPDAIPSAFGVQARSVYALRVSGHESDNFLQAGADACECGCRAQRHLYR